MGGKFINWNKRLINIEVRVMFNFGERKMDVIEEGYRGFLCYLNVLVFNLSNAYIYIYVIFKIVYVNIIYFFVCMIYFIVFLSK